MVTAVNSILNNDALEVKMSKLKEDLSPFWTRLELAMSKHKLKIGM